MGKLHARISLHSLRRYCENKLNDRTKPLLLQSTFYMEKNRVSPHLANYNNSVIVTTSTYRATERSFANQKRVEGKSGPSTFCPPGLPCSLFST